jgi:hypothetical protein
LRRRASRAPRSRGGPNEASIRGWWGSSGRIAARNSDSLA